MKRSTARASEAGQTLIISAGIILVLAVGVAVVVLLHQTGIRHQISSTKQAQGHAVAEAGLSYATQLLAADPATWNKALNALSNSDFPTDCNSGANVPGTQFQLTCANVKTANAAQLYPGLQAYQIAVVSTAWLPGANGQPVPTSVQSYISQKTMDISLPSGLRASAALELVNVPTGNPPPNTPLPANSLLVHWGPIVDHCFDGNIWTLSDPLDQYSGLPGYPRKFSNGGIAGGAGSPYPRAPSVSGSTGLTDQKEYWAFAGISFPQMVSEYFYQNAAYAEILQPAITCNGACTISASGGIYTVLGDVTGKAVFNDSFTLPPLTPPGTIIYVNGNAEFDKLQLDLSTGAIVITGDLTLGPSGISSPAEQTLNIPLTAPQEYPYWPTVSKWPCQDQCAPNTTNRMTCAGAPLTCSATAAQGGILTGVNFRGFLWVKGNLYVTQPGWTIAGTVLVGDMGSGKGQLIITPGSSLTIFYDAIVNHAIQVIPG